MSSLAKIRAAQVATLSEKAAAQMVKTIVAACADSSKLTQGAAQFLDAYALSQFAHYEQRHLFTNPALLAYTLIDTFCKYRNQDRLRFAEPDMRPKVQQLIDLTTQVREQLCVLYPALLTASEQHWAQVNGTVEEVPA